MELRALPGLLESYSMSMVSCSSVWVQFQCQCHCSASGLSQWPPGSQISRRIWIPDFQASCSVFYFWLQQKDVITLSFKMWTKQSTKSGWPSHTLPRGSHCHPLSMASSSPPGYGFICVHVGGKARIFLLFFCINMIVFLNLFYYLFSSINSTSQRSFYVYILISF